MSKFFATWDPQRISDFEAKLSDKDKPVFETAREFGVGIKQAWNFITNRDIKRGLLKGILDEIQMSREEFFQKFN